MHMAGLIRQFTALLKNGLETLLEPAEDPRKTFSSPQQRQGELLTRVREALERNTALRKRLDDRIAQLQAKIPQLEEAAKQAIAAERDDLARLALQQHQLASLELKALETNLQEAQLEERRIAILEQRLTAQIEAMRVRQEMTAVRYTAAESQVMVNEAIHGASRELIDLGQSIEQTEQKAEHMQARAFAIEQLADLDALDLSGNAIGDPLGQQLLQVELEKAVEQQLSALKSARRIASK
jgi:phage shock protein A